MGPEEIYNNAYYATLEKIAANEGDQGFWDKLKKKAVEYGRKKNRKIYKDAKSTNRKMSTNQFKDNKSRIKEQNKSFLRNE